MKENDNENKKADKVKKKDKHKDAVTELQEKLETLQAEKDDLFEKLQRVSADYANYQKRSARQITDSVSYEKEAVIKSLLPALDNFEHMLTKSHSAETVDVVVKGVQIIFDQMLDILKSLKVERIEAEGQDFDPNLHQAMMRKTDPDQPENVVLEVFQTGYKLNGRVIRPAMVIVNKREQAERRETPEERQGQQQPDESNGEGDQ